MRNYYPKRNEEKELIEELKRNVEENKRQVKLLEKEIQKFIEDSKSERRIDFELSIIWGVGTTLVSIAALIVSLVLGLS